MNKNLKSLLALKYKMLAKNRIFLYTNEEKNGCRIVKTLRLILALQSLSVASW